MDVNNLRQQFILRNLQGQKSKKVNEGIWHLFRRLYEGRNDFERCYIIAEEFNALTMAIASLDNHICRLIGNSKTKKGD
jgi:hypothetical protein